MDEMNKNKMDDMEMDKVSGGRRNPGGGGYPKPSTGCHDSNANSMAANVDIDKTQNASGWLVP
jgi:hypothetical protein